MPFLTDNGWPKGLLAIFEVCRNGNQPLESRYYGPYTKLLTYCFGDPDSFNFFVAPQTPPDEELRKETAGFVVFLVVYNADQRPVLIANIKNDNWAGKAVCRLDADQQLRRCYESMLGACPLPRLWGLSLLGTSLRVYCGDVATEVITPPYQARPGETYIVTSGFLKGEWNLDILSQEGFEKVKEIVKDITTSNAAV